MGRGRLRSWCRDAASAGRPAQVWVNAVYRFNKPVGPRKRDFAPGVRTLGPAAAH